MAQKIQTMLIDDINGEEASRTVTFALDGVAYEIDLTEDHAKELTSAMERFVKHARKSGRAAGGARRGSSRRSPSDTDPAAVREWAAKHGIKVSDRGRVAAPIVDAYKAAGDGTKAPTAEFAKLVESKPTAAATAPSTGTKSKGESKSKEESGKSAPEGK